MAGSAKKNSILVKDVYKRFGTECVLQGLSMKIPDGSMYGLLGPSGCGKTTLLKCILGQLEIDSGTIELSVNKWSRVGFMPQSSSLHGELKIEELFIFYGFIYGIKITKLKKRVEELRNLLDIPPSSTLIANCSGGQQRRISLAVTLLHYPDLILLDEPTVGLDPLLANRIWNYLKELSQNHNKTIVVTTHYMEEARTLHLVGLMRNGELMAERSPDSILDKYDSSTLDDVFLKLANIKENTKSQKGNISINKSTRSRPHLKNERTFNWNHFRAQTYKNYKWTYRNLPVSLFVILMPALCVIILTQLYTQEGSDLKVGYYNEEFTNASCSNMQVVHVDDCAPSPLYSCQYLDILRNKRVLERLNSLEEGLELIRKGDIYALIYLPYNFTETIINRMNFQIIDLSKLVSESPIQVWMDNTIFHIAYHTKTDVYTALLKLMEIKCKECNIDVRFARTTLNVRLQKPVYGENNKLISRVYSPILNGLIFYMAFVYTSAAAIMEKSSGVLERVQMSGMTTGELLLSNFIFQFAMMNLINVASLIAVHVICMEVYLGSLTLMYIILLLNQFCGSLIGMLALTFTSEAYTVNYVGATLMLSIVSLNGSVWPTEGIHWLLKPISDYSPVVMSGNSYTQVMLHGFGLSHKLVYGGIIYIIAWNIIITVMIALKIKLNNNKL